LALGAFGDRSPGTSQVTGAFQLPQPWLGMTTTGAPGGAGALVTKVAAGGPADQAGLHRGDLITAIDGQAITGPAEITSVVGAQPVGAEVLLQVDRAGTLETVGVIVAGQPGRTP
jgi:S1-C subfamily serine protease